MKAPAQQILKETASRLFEVDTGLRVEPESWRYKTIPESGVAEATFSLSNGKETIFNNVLILAQYEKNSIHKLKIQASINGFSPMHRVFFVLN